MCNTVKQCGVLLLAGGKSSRMGQNKALLEHDGVPMIQRLAEQCVAFPEKLLSSPIELPVEGYTRFCDDLPDCGPLGGLVTALRRCRSDALLVLSCDLACYRSELGNYLLSFLERVGDAQKTEPGRVWRAAFFHPGLHGLGDFYSRRSRLLRLFCQERKRLNPLRLLCCRAI